MSSEVKKTNPVANRLYETVIKVLISNNYEASVHVVYYHARVRCTFIVLYILSSIA